MSVQRIGSGRFRAQVWDPDEQTKVSVTKLLTPAELDDLGAENGTFADRDSAVAARVLGKKRLKERRGNMTVAEWRETWLSQSTFSGHWTESTRIHRRERTQEFTEDYGHLLVKQVDDKVLASFLRGGKRRGRRTGNRDGQVPALRVMFNDAMSAAAGRMLDYNPFAAVKLKKSRGNKDKQPPTEEAMRNMLAVAAELTPPSFADYLALGCFTAMRPGELDALEWKHIRWDESRIDVHQQWNVKEKRLTDPKKGKHTVALVGPARETLQRARAYAQEGVPWVFPTLGGSHYTPSSRSTHWNKVRVGAGITEKTLYLCTRHYFGWFAYVVLGQPKEIVAAQLGHTDGRKLIEQLYGHPDHSKRLDQLIAAFGEISGKGAPRPDHDPAPPALRLVTPSEPDHEPVRAAG